MRTLKSIQSEKLHVYYRYTCPHCGEVLVMTAEELQRIMFEPVEQEYEYWQGGFGLEHRKIGTHMVSSDSSKDVFRFTCCNCGHVVDVSTQGYWQHHCDEKGRQIESFELTEKQTEELKAWQATQKEKMKGMRRDPMGFSYEYRFVPGGIGTMIKVKCNYTGDEIDLTHSEEW